MINKDYTVEGLLSDETFQQSVLAGKQSEYIRRHKIEDDTCKKNIEEASTILLFMKVNRPTVGKKKIEANWQQLEDSLKFIKDKPIVKDERTVVSKIWSYAAVIALLIVSLWVFKSWNTSPNNLVYQTAFGEKKSLLLKDGTRVYLNANSSLRIADNLIHAGQRQVWLEGEGFFEVMKDEEQGTPFVVHAGSLDVLVMGTAFNVWSREEEVSVTLKEGRVRLIKDQVHKDMFPGQMLTYLNDKEDWIEEDENINLNYAWVENKIILKKTPLTELVKTLEANFGVTVHIKDSSLLTRELSGTIPDNDLDVVLGVLQELLEVRIARDDQRIDIYK